MRNQLLSNIFCFILFLLLNCSIINCTSLIGSRTTGNLNTNRIIHASLTDKDSGRVWRIQESIYSDNTIAGRIEIKSDESEANVFYSYKNKLDNKKRLVIHDNTCDLYNYNLKWDNLLPGVTKPLTNLILLLGPSLFDRFEKFNWITGNDEVVRGARMRSLTADLDGKLNITLYYEDRLHPTISIEQPSQIVFTGHNPDTLVEGEGETLILDIYLQSQVEQSLEKQVQVTPGFGCPTYLNGDRDFPELVTSKIHFIAAELVNNGERVITEYHADETYQILRQSVLKYGFKREALFDYTLCAAYSISSSGSCNVYAIDANSPGIDESGSFSIARLLWLPKTLKYLGEITFEHRSGYEVYVWESIEINRVINGVSYDKVVTVQYLNSDSQSDVFKRYSLVAASIKGYKKDAKGAYVLSYTSHRDYYDSNSDLPESTYHEALQIEDCYQKPDERLTLKFHLTCKDSEGCIQKSQKSVYKLKEIFKSNLLGQLGISSVRVADIDFKFQQEVIQVDVTFLEAPQISDVLPYESVGMIPQSNRKLHETTVDTPEKCIRYHSSFVPSGGVIIWCRTGNLCFSTTSPKDVVKSDKGTWCTVFTDPFKKLNRLGQEKPLSDLHDHILGYFGHITFNLDLDQKAKAVVFQVTDVIAQSQVTGQQQKPFKFLYYGSQFNEIDGVNTVMVPGIDRFGDCYRACSQNEDIPCETFSFCNIKDKKQCVVSIWTGSQIANNRTSQSSCVIHAKNHLSDFNIRQYSKFKNPTTVSREMKITGCAEECYGSKDCVSFQFCSGECTLSGLIATSTNTEYDMNCDIYVAKSSEKYKVTGMKLVSKVLYTQVDIDLDQCAAICDDDQSCKSFNFCPKGKSSSQCQITSFSIKDPKTESVESSICHNFELTVNSAAKQTSNNNPDIKVSGVNGGGVFGIIIAFLFVGLFVGFVGPYVFTKVKSTDLTRSNDNFGWSKHENDDENLTQI